MDGAHARPITLMYFTDSLAPSGVGRHLALLTSGINRDRFRPVVVCPDTPSARPLFKQLKARGITVYPLTVRYDEPDDYPKLLRLIEDEQVMIFHAQNGVTWEGHLGVYAAHQAGVPVILATEHLPFVLDKKDEIRIKTEINRLIHQVIAVSEGVRDSHIASGTIHAHQISAIPNGIDPAPFLDVAPADATRERAALGVAPNVPLIGTVARLEEQKGHWFLLLAARRVLERYPDARFVMYGDGSLRFVLEDFISHALDLQDNVIWAGERNDVPTFMSACDAIVLPSLFEGMPLTALEAMAAGRPFVGTVCCGTGEIVIHEQTGLLVPPSDERTLAEAIIRILDHPSLADKLGKAGRAHVLAHFNVPLMIKRYLTLYNAMLAKFHV